MNLRSCLTLWTVILLILIIVTQAAYARGETETSTPTPIVRTTGTETPTPIARTTVTETPTPIAGTTGTETPTPIVRTTEIPTPTISQAIPGPALSISASKTAMTVRDIATISISAEDPSGVYELTDLELTCNLGRISCILAEILSPYEVSASGVPATLSFSPDEPGTYVFTAQATWTRDYRTVITTTDSVAVTVEALSTQNSPPEAVIITNATGGITPLDVAFDGSGSTDSDGSIQEYCWTFGPYRALSSEISPVYRYETPGIYTVTLKVRDNDGAEDSAAMTIIAVEEEGLLAYRQMANGTPVKETDEDQQGIPGDIDGDGKVTTKDALAVLQMSLAKREAVPKGDMDGNGRINVLDAVKVLRLAIKTRL